MSNKVVYILNNRNNRVYTTQELPMNALEGTICFNSSIKKPVYFSNGTWYDFSNIDVKDNTVDIYILSGQSNAIGQGIVSELTNEQKSENALFWRSYHTDQNNAQSQQQFESSWATEIKAGFTGGNNQQSFGPEIGFSKYMSTKNTRPFGILKYALGSSSLTSAYNPSNTGYFTSDWDVSENATGKDGDCWRAWKLALEEGIKQLTNEGYYYRIAGIIWWQGESGGTATELNTFIAAARKHIKDNYITDTKENRLPVVIAGGLNWGTDFEEFVAKPDPYIGFINTHILSGSQNPSPVHPGSGEGTTSSDGNNSGNNDMYDIGVEFGKQMIKAIAGETAVWSPSNLSTTLWFDATDTSTLQYDSNGNLTMWSDKSQNIDNPSIFTNISRNGTINNKPVMTFNSNSVMRGGTTEWKWQEVYMVAQWGGGETFSNYNALFTGGVRYGIIILGNKNNSSLYTASTLANTYKINSEVIQSNTNIINLLKKDTNNANLGGGIMYASSNSQRSLNGWAIGVQSDHTDGRGWVGKIGEILTFDTVLSNSDRQKVEGYLAHKWGFQDKLPNDHIYKTSEP